MMGILLAALQLGIVINACVCLRNARNDRSYWPMIRIIFVVLVAVYGGSFAGNIGNMVTGSAESAPPFLVRVIFNAAICAATGYAHWFIRKRNRTPRFVRLDLGGNLTMISVPEVDRGIAVAESTFNHGVARPEQAGRMRAALDEYDRKRRWAEEDLPRQIAERRARRGGGGR
jgi:hypothetical protein